MAAASTQDMHSILSPANKEIERFQIMHERRLSSRQNSQVLPINAYDFLLNNNSLPQTNTQLMTMLSTVHEKIEEFQETDNDSQIIKHQMTAEPANINANLLKKMLEPLHDNLEIWGQKEDNSKTIKLMLQQKEIAMNQLRKRMQSVAARNTFNLTSCENIRNCEAMKLIVMLLKHYEDFDDNFTKIVMEIESKHKRFVLNLYHHIVMHHLQQEDRHKSDVEFNEIYTRTVSGLRAQCDISLCSKYSRHRERERFVYSDKHIAPQRKEDIRAEFYMDLLDMMHCNILHTYDTGMRSTAEEHKSSIEVQPETEAVYNKYYTEIIETTHAKSTVSFDFGHKFYYWDAYRDNEYFDSAPNEGDKKGDWFIEQKYADLQEEILDNEIFTLHKYHFDRALKKAEEYLESSMARGMSSDSVELSEYCEIRPGSDIKKENLLALILYSDYTRLCTEFSATFRKLHDETFMEMKDRNSEYRNWSKLLVETVEIYGKSICNSEIQIFYHGVSYMTFPSFLSYFCGPTSTTPQVEVANNFCGKKGLILELKKENDFSLLKYFDVQWISSFTNEDERLFIWGNKPLKFHSITCVKSRINYYHYIVALTFFDYILNGKRLTKSDKKRVLYNKKHAKIINELLKHHDTSTQYKNKLDKYINLTFETFVANRKNISIHLNAVNEDYPFIRQNITYMFHKKSKNLLLFHQIAKVFRKCESVTVWSDPKQKNDNILTISYLDQLREILTDLNHRNDKLLLKTIKLNDVRYYDGSKLRFLDHNKFKKKYKVQFPFCSIKVETRTRRRGKNKKRVIVRSDLIIDRSMTKKLIYNVQELSRAASAKRPSITAMSQATNIHREWSGNSDSNIRGHTDRGRPGSQRPSASVYNPSVTLSKLHQVHFVETPVSTSTREHDTGGLTPAVPRHSTHGSGFPATDFGKASKQSAVMTLGSIHEVPSNKSSTFIEKEVSVSYEPSVTDEFNAFYVNEDAKEAVIEVDPLKTRYSHIVISKKPSSKSLWDEAARIIWNASCLENENSVKLEDLYSSLMLHFKQVTKIQDNNIPTMKELSPFIKKYIYSADKESLSIHQDEFEQFYSWFHSICLIINDFKHIYYCENAVFCTLFYTQSDAQQALSKRERGTFLLRIGDKTNRLHISCKDKKRIRQYLFVRTRTEMYRIGESTLEKKIFMHIKYSKQFKFLYSPDVIITSLQQKDTYF